MAEQILCKICGKRRARRLCPAVHGDICSICCGTEREVSLTCPLDCEYLREAHRHEKTLPFDAEQLPNADVVLSEEALAEHEELLLFCVYTLLQAGLRTEGAIDSDLLAALEALIQTQRTLASGLFYETKPENALALAIQRSFTASLDDYRKLKAEREPLSPVRDSAVLIIMVFLQRIGLSNRSERPRSRLFLDNLRQMTPEMSVEAHASSIIV